MSTIPHIGWEVAMKLQDTVVSLRDNRDQLTSDEQQALDEICAQMVDLSSAKEEVSAEQQELVDYLLRTMDDLAHAAYGLARALEGR